MACTVHISSVLGTSLSSTSTQIQIEGTATDCTELVVKITCGQFTVNINVPVAPDGTWSLITTTDCLCDGPTVIDAVCLAGGCSDHFSGNLPCTGPCCPRLLTGTPSVGNCDSQGKRPVTINTQVGINNGPGCFPVSIQWDFGDGTTGPVQTYNTAGTFNYSISHTYAPGNYTASLNVITPTGCPSAHVSVSVATCTPPCCPDLESTVKIGDCDCNGNRTVTFTNNVTVGTSPLCKPVTVQRDFGDGSLGASQTFNTPGLHTYTESHAYPGNNGTYNSYLNVVTPFGCESLLSVIAIGCCYESCSLKAFCELMKYLFYIGLVVGLIIIGLVLGSCVNDPYGILLYTALGFLSMATTAAILLAIFCTKCLPCGFVLIWSANVLMINGFIAMTFGNCCPGMLIIGGIYLIVGFLLALIWMLVCNKSWCDMLYALFFSSAMAFWLGAVPWGVLFLIFPCVQFWFLILLALWLILLAIYTNVCPQHFMMQKSRWKNKLGMK